MSLYCLNLDCPQPQNPDRHRFCQTCGQRLQLGDRFQAVQRFNVAATGSTAAMQGSWLGWDTQTIIQPRCLIKATQAQGQTTQAQQADLRRSRQFAVRFGSLGVQTQLSTLLAYYERDRSLYIVQSWLNGETAAQRVQQRGTFTADELIAFLHSSLVPLAQLHQQGLVHRDLNPHNVIQVPGRTDWCLTGLDVAKVVTATPQSQLGTRVGSAEYAAPEQVRGQATPASDLYSLGVVALHLLTRLSPFDLIDLTTGQWLWRSVSSPVPDRLAAILDRLLAVNRRDRYATVTQVQADLATLAAPPVPLAPAIPYRITAQMPPANWLPPVALIAPPGIPGSSSPLSSPSEAESVATPTPAAIHSLAWRSDGQGLAIGRADHQVEWWEVAQEQVSRAQTLTGHQGVVTTIAIVPDAQTIISGSWDTTLRCWNVANPTDSPRLLRQHTAAVTTLTVLPNGEIVVSGGRDRQLIWWHWPTGQELQVDQTHLGEITAIAVSPDRPLLASADAAGWIHLWSTQSRQRLRTLPQRSGQVTALAWAADGILISTHWDLQTLWQQADTGGLLHVHTNPGLPLQALCGTTDPGCVLTLGRDRLEQWWLHPTQHQVEVQSFVAPTGETLQAIDYAAGTQTLAGGTIAGRVYLWPGDHPDPLALG